MLVAEEKRMERVDSVMSAGAAVNVMTLMFQLS